MADRQKKQLIFLKQTFQLQGGLEKYCLLLANRCADEGFSTTLITSSDPPEGHIFTNWQWLKIWIPKIKLSFCRLLFFDFFVRREVKRMQKRVNNVVIGFDRHFLPLDIYRAGNGCHRAYLARRMKEASFFKKIALFFNPLHFVTLWTERKTFYCPRTTIICNSNMVLEEIRKYYPKVQLSQLVVIHNGIDWISKTDAFERALVDQQFFKRQFSVPSQALHIVFVGNEWYRKGADLLIEAIHILKPELDRNHIQFYVTIAGKERSPQTWVDLLEKYDLSDHIQLIPHSVSTTELFQSADIAVVPSRYDPFANVTVEALALGLWTVTTKENGGKEVIVPQINGAVAEALTPEALSVGILEGVFRLLRLEITKRSIRMTVKDLDFKKSLEKYLAIIREKGICS